MRPPSKLWTSTACGLALISCTSVSHEPRPLPVASQGAVPPAARADVVADAPASPDAGPSPAAHAELAFAAPARAQPTASQIARALFGATPPAEAAACHEDARCLLALGYAADARARELVLDLFDRFRTVVLPGKGETMDMSYRGRITVEPVLALGAERKHLEWAHAACDAIAEVLRQPTQTPVAIRFPAVLSFVRSLHGKHTPSGYALDWQYTYNVQGSLNVSADSVRSVAIHEMFHLVDSEAGSSWSEHALGDDVRAILGRCHDEQTCLARHAPTMLRVRGGTFYAFQPGNDVVAEYAAELATRVFDEQRAQLGAGPKLGAFKCGPAPNAKAWHAMVERYFGGLDRVPDCL